MATLVYAVDRPDVPPYKMSDRFKHEITYFMSIPEEHGVPKMPAHDYWIAREHVESWLDEGVFRLVSPLDSENKTEIELSEEQESWLEWMLANNVQHVHLV
jgi:hypothetical protein